MPTAVHNYPNNLKYPAEVIYTTMRKIQYSELLWRD
jgi:hypothetical protein